MDLPLGDTMTGCVMRCSPGGGRFKTITRTDPRLVPTHKHGQVNESTTEKHE